MAFVVLFFAVCVLLSVKLISDKFSRIVVFLTLIVWMLGLFLSACRVYDFYEISEQAYIYYFLSIIMFMLGVISLNSLFPKTDFKYWNSPAFNINSFDVNTVINNKFFRYTFIISFVEILYLATTQWQVIVLQGSIGSLKVNMFELVFHGNSVLYFIYQAVCFPVFYLVLVIESILILQQKKDWIKIAIFGVFIIAFCFVGGKRGYYSQFLMYFIFIFIFKYKQLINTSARDVVKKRNVIKLAIVFGIAFFGASLTTSMYDEDGGGNVREAGNDLVRQVVSYKVGPLVAFDKALEKDYLGSIGGYQYGRATLGGAIDYYGCSILSMAGIKVRQVRDITMSPLQNNFIFVGKDNTMNFAYTSLIYFYFDLGVFGIIIFSFMFGMIVRYCVFYLKKKRTIGSVLLVTFMCLACQSFFASWVNIALYTQFLIVYAVVLSKKEIAFRKHQLRVNANN